MFTALTLRPRSFLGRAALLVFALATGSGALAQGNPNATMTIASDPSPNTDPPQWATVSRDAAGSVGAADYYIAYTVSITNPTNSSKNFKFIANFTVSGVGEVKPPTDMVPSRTDCAYTVSELKVTCPKLEVAKGKTITFTLRFRTPTAGESMTMMGNLYFPVSSNTVAVTRSTTIELREQEAEDYRLGFYTYVPTTGGTFCTGDNGNGGPNNPGCVPKIVDPITTTIIVAGGSVSAPTTARVQESQATTCTSANFTECFDSSLTIPDATFSPPLQVILRIDRTKIYTPGNPANINVFYENSPNPVPPCAGSSLPQPGQPCWAERGIYPFDFVPEDFRFDYYVRILARNNGTYRLR
jgi:hypothetical protein